MSVTLKDNSKAELSWSIDGCRKIEFKALNKTIVLPFATVATVGLVQKLYIALCT